MDVFLISDILDKRRTAMHKDIREELMKANIYALNLRSPYYTNSTRFWMPVHSKFSLGEETQVRFIVNSLPDNATKFPDVQFVVLKQTLTVEDHYLETPIIDFSPYTDISIVPRLVELTKNGQVVRYYMDAHHRSSKVHLDVHYPNNTDFSTDVDGVLLQKFI